MIIKPEKYVAIKTQLAMIGYYHGRNYKVFAYYSKKNRLYDIDDHGNSELFIDYNFKREYKTVLELYIEVLKNQYPKMEGDTMMLVAIREINNYTELEMAKILKISEFAYRELESGTHGFTEKISRTYFGEIFNLTREEMRIWMNMI